MTRAARGSPWRGTARAAVTSDPARRQPIRAQVVSKPKISTSAKVKMEGSGARGGSPPGVPGGRRRRGGRGAGGGRGRGHAGVRPAEEGPERDPRPQPRAPLSAPHFASRPRPGDAAPCPRAPAPGVAGEGTGAGGGAGSRGRHFPDLLHGCNSCPRGT